MNLYSLRMSVELQVRFIAFQDRSCTYHSRFVEVHFTANAYFTPFAHSTTYLPETHCRSAFGLHSRRTHIFQIACATLGS